MAEEYIRMHKDNGIFQFRADGFTVHLLDERLTILWQDITMIVDYRQPLITRDETMIRVTAAEQTFEISESVRGYFQFLQHAEENLRSFRSGTLEEFMHHNAPQELIKLFEKTDE